MLVDWFRRQGVPDEVMQELIEQGALWRPFIRFQPDPRLLDPGDHVDGWRAVAAPGHADGQLMLVRDDVLVAADHVLDPITPTVGLWPRSRPDPLGDYLDALEATIALDARVALPGHGEPILDPSARARALIDGRDYATPHDLKRVAPDVLRHRVVPSYEAEADGVTAESLVRAVLDAVETA